MFGVERTEMRAKNERMKMKKKRTENKDKESIFSFGLFSLSQGCFQVPPFPFFSLVKNKRLKRKVHAYKANSEEENLDMEKLLHVRSFVQNTEAM